MSDGVCCAVSFVVLCNMLRFIHTMLHTSAGAMLQAWCKETQRSGSKAIQLHVLFRPLPALSSMSRSCSFSATKIARRVARFRHVSARVAGHCLLSRFVLLVVVGKVSKTAAAESEDQVQCRAALESVLFGGLVVGPMGRISVCLVLTLLRAHVSCDASFLVSSLLFRLLVLATFLGALRRLGLSCHPFGSLAACRCNC
jgi:hypothetical protein